jgi:NCS1 family nucleobase:cation symporter-1
MCIRSAATRSPPAFIFLGLTGWQVLISMLVGITAVYFLMNLIGRPSLRYGIPFPVVARISFGVMGANLAAMVRGVVGIVWYGVQTYFASKAVQVLVITMMPSAADFTHNSVLGLSTLGWFSFLFMWVFQLLIFLSGMERIRRFIDFCGPVVYVVMFAMAAGSCRRAASPAFRCSSARRQPRTPQPLA